MVTQTTPIVNFDRRDLNIVANRAIGIVGNDKRWCDVINRAVVNLASGRFSFDGHVVSLHSASGDGVYRIDVREPMECTCKGRARGYRCWHIVAARLILRAAEHHAEQQASVGVTYKGVYYTPAQLEASKQQRMSNARRFAQYDPSTKDLAVWENGRVIGHCKSYLEMEASRG